MNTRGILFASALILTWAASHIACVFFYDWQHSSRVLVPFLICWLCWLYVGLFIVAHDCMHGTLSSSPRVNRVVGTLCLLVYACFDFVHMREKHHAHHAYAGTARDPDFFAPEPPSFRAWYLKFFREYSTLKQYLGILALSWSYMLLFHVSAANVLVFWALPAILSSLQLFAFGTYFPHRPGSTPFGDRHNARSNDYPRWLSLMTCFHFGYHHEHHLAPHLPWWRLPEARARQTCMLPSTPST
ncbi:MAG TPA: fatty acid desaturase [Polyangiales bacterium]|nr:fatty acid desaturase [Polyangiales bacterium]